MRKLPIILFICLLFPARPAAAGQVDVSVLLSAEIAPYRQASEGFRETVEQSGRTIRVEEHFLKGNRESLQQRIDREKPRLLLALGPEAAQFAHASLPDTPLVVSMMLRPQSLEARNATWVCLEIPARARLGKIRQLLPGVRTIGMVFSADSAALYREIVQAGGSLGLRVVGLQIESGKDLPEAFAGIAPQIDLFLMVPDTKVFFPQSIQYLLVEALKNRMPVVGLATSYTRAGALLSFEADYRNIGRQAGEMALRILDGVKPASIKPADPREIRTSLNLVVAERLGIRLNEEAVLEVSEVFR